MRWLFRRTRDRVSPASAQRAVAQRRGVGHRYALSPLQAIFGREGAGNRKASISRSSYSISFQPSSESVSESPALIPARHAIYRPKRARIRRAHLISLRTSEKASPSSKPAPTPSAAFRPQPRRRARNVRGGVLPFYHTGLDRFANALGSGRRRGPSVCLSSGWVR